MDTIYQRTETLLGKEKVNSLKEKRVLIFGLGGVGSYALEALARVGIGNMMIVDKDVVDITNINRQIIALHSTIGKSKVEVAKERIMDINPKMTVTARQEWVTQENISSFFQEEIHYVIDAIDDVSAKICIIQECNKRGIPCISCMGTGNKLDPMTFKIEDIFKTNTCPLAKIMRKKLKELGISKQKVLFSTELPKKSLDTSVIGSVSFVPSVAGLLIASEVVKEL